MREFVSTISSKGQVTIPAAVLHQLGVGATDKIAFVLTDEGKVELRLARYTLDSVLGSLEALPDETVHLDREIEKAVEEGIARNARGDRSRLFGYRHPE